MNDNMTDEEIRKKISKAKRRKLMKQRFILISVVLLLAVGGGYLAGRSLGNDKYDSDNPDPVATADTDSPLVQTAIKEVGNVGGEPFWSWYGFNSRVEWCACYVSWCEDQVGYLESGAAPKFALVRDGANWFDGDQWLESGSTPGAGDLVFFDWEQDGVRDHVGIVTAVINDRVFTVEGNSSDRCRVKSYPLDSPVIYGYGRIKEG